MDFGSIHSTATATATKKIEENVGRVLVALQEMMEGPLPSSVKTSVARQVADFIETAGMSLLTPDGISQVVAGNTVSALGAGTPAPAGTPDNSAIMAALSAMATDLGVPDAQTLVANMGRMFAPVLNETDPRVRNARMVGMAKAADGSIPFTTTGDVDHTAAVAPVQAELDNERDPLHVGSHAHRLAAANSQIHTLTSERDASLVKVADKEAIITGLQNQWTADMASLKALVDADRSLKGRLSRGKAGLRPDVQTALGL